jgi:hypothetical protein
VEANGLALSTRFSVDAVTLNRLIADACLTPTVVRRHSGAIRTHQDFDSGAFGGVSKSLNHFTLSFAQPSTQSCLFSASLDSANK